MKIFTLLSIVVGFFIMNIELSHGGNLAIRKSGPANANPGDLITYTITYSNTVPTLENNVVITDYLPDAANCTYYSSSPSGVYNSITNTVKWNSAQLPKLASLDAGTGENTIQVTIRMGKSGTGINQSEKGYYLNASPATLSTSADIKSDQTTTPVLSDAVTTVVTYDCTFKISQPSAGIKSATGSTLTYLVALTNTGNIYQKYSLASILYSGQNLFQSIQNLSGGVISETPFIAPDSTWLFHYVLTTPNGTKPNEYTETQITAKPNNCGATQGAIYRTFIYGGSYGNYELLSVYKIDTSDPVQSGSQLTYQIVISNVGSALANVRLTETYPANTTFVSATSSGSSVTTGNNVWDFASLPAGNTIITVTLDVANELPDGTILNNTVEISSNGLVYDTYTESTTVVSAPDLSITKTAKVVNPPAGPDSIVNYTLTYTNHGNYTASGVVIKDHYDKDLMNAGSFGTGIYTEGEITWNIPGTLAPGESGIIHYSMKIIDDDLLYQKGSTNILNSAVISSTLTDRNISDNTASATVNVFLLPDLKIEKKADPMIGIVDQPITYKLSVSNVGKLDHSGSTYTVVDVLPAGTTYLSSTPAGGLYNAGTVTWTISDDLPVNETKNFTVTLDAIPCSLVGNGTLFTNATVNSNLYGDANNSNNEVTLITDVVDDVKPTIASPDPITVNNDKGKCSAEVLLTVPATVDNCGVLSVTNDHASTIFPVGTTKVIWTVTDIHGNTTTALQNIIVNDVSAPTPDVETLFTLTGECSVTVTAPTATDNCKGSVTGATTDPLTYSTLGTYIIDWAYNDGNGNTSTQTQTVIVGDITAPVPDVVSLPTLTGQSIVIASVPTATDNCEGAVTGTTTDPLTYTVQGSYTITWTYDDGNGNSSTQTQTVVVDETAAPETPVLADITVGECSGTPTAPTLKDNNSEVITGTTTTVFPITAQGKTVVTWTFDDGNGNVSSATQNVIVDDLTAPVPDVASLPTLTGECRVEVTAPTATDNCKGPITGTTTDPLTYSAQGTYTINWTYDDGNGNSLTQTQSVVVDDVTAPVPDVASLPTLSGSSIVMAPIPTATDNCIGLVSGTTIDPLTYTVHGTYTINWIYDDGNGNSSTQTQTVVVGETAAPETPVLADITVGECSGTPTAPTIKDNNSGIITGTTTTVFPITAQGKTVVTWTFDDGNGNVSSATQNVIVDDLTAPVPDVASLPTLTGECSVEVTAPTATDNCKGSITGITTDPLTYSAQGTYTINWTYDDGNGNTSTQIQSVVVDDITPPEKPILADVTLGECGGTPPTPTTTDNCKGTVYGTTSILFPKTRQGEFTILWTFDDGNGNVITAYQNLIVDDITAPVPDVASLPTLTGECNVIVNAPTATDNCVGTITGTTTDPLTYSAQGTYTINWTYDDGNGNISIQTQSVVVDDITPPEKPILADVTLGECGGTPPTPTTTDNCKGTVYGTTSILFPKTKQGKFTILWTFDDGNGNVTTAYQNLIVDDVTAPVPDVAALPTLTGECSVTPVVPTATDNCSGVITGTTSTVFPITTKGTTVITWTFDDGNGNTSTTTQNVIVDDVIAPEIKGTLASMTIEGCWAEDVYPAEITVEGLEALGLSISDACTSNAFLAVTSRDVESGSDPLTVMRTYIVTDASNNSSKYIQSIAVMDTQNPSIIGPPDIIVNADPGDCNVSGVALGTPITEDNCSISLVQNNAPTVFKLGTTIVTWTVTDKSGNTATCQQTVTVDGTPVANDDRIEVQENTQITGNVTINDEVLCDKSIIVSVHTGPVFGILMIGSDGNYTYIPQSNYSGTDIFTYKLCDLDGDCSLATVEILINSTNELPQANADAGQLQVDVVYSGDVAENDVLSGDGNNVWTLLNPPAHGTISFNPDGTYTYAPVAGFIGSDRFTYQLCDANGDCSQANVSISVDDVLLPNQILTPNHDGNNDQFIIGGIEYYPVNKVTVYNRWGNVVYQKNNYQNEWDGSSNLNKVGSKPLPVGTYYYLIDYGNNRHKTGFVYLDR